jgi:hypothetical protein
MSMHGIQSAHNRPDATPTDIPQTRCCLRCRTPFQSAGFGERICRACKGTNAWRTTIPIRRSRPRGRMGPGSD